MICGLCGGKGYIQGHRCAQCFGGGEELTQDQRSRRLFKINLSGGIDAPAANVGGEVHVGLSLEITVDRDGFTDGELVLIMGYIEEFAAEEKAKVAARIVEGGPQPGTVS